MAYRVIAEDGTQSVQLVDAGEVYRSFVTEWICDPCNRSSERYQVLHPAGWRFHPWYEVITQDDDERTRKAKIEFSSTVAHAQQQVNDAENRLRQLTR